MEARLSSLRILTANVDTHVAFWRDRLNLAEVGRTRGREGGETVQLRDRFLAEPVALSVQGPPFDRHLAQDFERHGPGLHAQTFESGDLAAIEERLQAAGVEYQYLPAAATGEEGLAFRDPYGVVVEIVSPAAPVAPPKSTHTGREYRLSHYCITCDDLAPGRAFYQSLDMRHVGPERDDGLVFLASGADLSAATGPAVPLELIGPPGLWDNDEAFLERRGPGLSYLCFSTPDLDPAVDDLLGSGVECTLGPLDVERTRIAFFRGPEDLDVEILLPIF